MEARSSVGGEPVQLAGDGGRGDGFDGLGRVRVANEVVAWITALAALEVPGVHAMYRPSGQSIDRILRRPVAHRGVRVTLQEDGTLAIDVHIAMEAGINLSSTGGAVQRRVAHAIDRMLGLELAEVNVFVGEVVFR